jgi:hypothetical protein
MWEVVKHRAGAAVAANQLLLVALPHQAAPLVLLFISPVII